MTILPDIFAKMSPECLQRESQKFADFLSTGGGSPFGGDDTTVGMEYELQVAVAGSTTQVDLPQTIRQSSYYRNTVKRAARGDAPQRVVLDLQAFLDRNPSDVWENSWVRFDPHLLGPFAQKTLATDLLADKRHALGPQRRDVDRFFTHDTGQPLLRIPVSYLLKLALACNLDPSPSLPPELAATGRRLLDHFQSDNTSPEILSLTIPRALSGKIGPGAAQETARTFLLIQLLTDYANIGFHLDASGQHCLVYHAPHAPSRQKQLNDLVPDGYYRHLFMSPCLSGWDRGEEKHRYMSLCHQTLSRSQLNAIGKLKDAGIICNNLVVLPNTSNTCLANNGTHVSLGSRLLTALAADGRLSQAVEKYHGDLVIKIIEHFLPLLVGTYSAAPYRLDFADFHPEKVLGFLPHELDYTHLRMLWRRWKKKADIRAFGKSLTPFGPRRLDTLLAKLLHLRGDLVPDFRLIDYYITLLSTDSSPALNGIPGNQERLKAELTELGIFDNRMSIYLPYRLRAFAHAGYSGFEGRSHSLFPSFLDDMARAVDLQNMITAFAYQQVIRGKVGHRDIPDHPFVESERRQIFFASAIGLPTVFIHSRTGNRFCRRILARVDCQRPSRRYKDFIRIPVDHYRRALVGLLRQEGAQLVDELGLSSTLDDLEFRLTDSSATAWHRLVAMTGGEHDRGRRAQQLAADGFNLASEKFYRTTLRQEHMREGLLVLGEDCARLDRTEHPLFKQIMASLDGTGPATAYLNEHAEDLVHSRAAQPVIRTVIHLVLAAIHTAE